MMKTLSEEVNRIREEKKACRREVRDKLSAVTDDYMREASAAISLNALTIKEMKAAKTVLAYCSVGSEPATLALISKLLESGKKVCLPLCIDLDEEGRRSGVMDAMEARRITGFEDLEPGAYGIPEPAAHTEVIAPEKIDIVILPCVTCDRNCNRLGHGAGYYDKYLKKIRSGCFTMALCYEAVMADSLPTEEHDMPVDAVVTEKQIYRWRR